MYENFLKLTTILTASFLIVIYLLWRVSVYLKANRKKLMTSAVIKTEGKVLRKFFGGGDSRISDVPHLTIEVTVNDKTVEVNKDVNRELFFAYEEGDIIELFVTNEEDMKVYPLAAITENQQSPI